MVGQIIGREPELLNSVTCAFFDITVESPDAHILDVLPADLIFAVLFVTRDLLDEGRWRVVGHRDVNVPRNFLPFESLRSHQFVGAKVIGSGIVESFVDAFYGLAPWDDWHDPKYLDGLLLNPGKGPKKKVLKQTS